uniref:Uncharacterized protein n=1 Tax=Cucumis melo TaxID=3656 RepID=A0A9I9EF52_CUCME
MNRNQSLASLGEAWTGTRHETEETRESYDRKEKSLRQMKISKVMEASEISWYPSSASSKEHYLICGMQSKRVGQFKEEKNCRHWMRFKEEAATEFLHLQAAVNRLLLFQHFDHFPKPKILPIPSHLAHECLRYCRLIGHGRQWSFVQPDFTKNGKRNGNLTDIGSDIYWRQIALRQFSRAMTFLVPPETNVSSTLSEQISDCGSEVLSGAFLATQLTVAEDAPFLDSAIRFCCTRLDP